METWLPVVGYEALFEISSKGRLKSLRTSRILSQTISKTGYYTHATKIGGRKGKSVCFKIHRLVCEAFHPNPENKPVVNHKDGNKLNNDKDNVEWATYVENSQHAHDTGLVDIKDGEDLPFSKLTFEQVEQIRIEYMRGDITYRELGLKYGVHHSTIYSAIKEKTWK